MAEINTNAQSYDAKQAAEEIASGEQAAQKVNVSADYEASKEFSQSSIDKTGEGAKAAEAATAPEFEVPQAQEPKHNTAADSNPDDYREMAREVLHGETGSGNVDDDLVKKAIDLGQPGH